MIEQLVRQVIEEKLGVNKISSQAGVTSIAIPKWKVSEEDRLDTGNPRDKVYTKDFFSLDESPQLGAGLMEMTDSTFPWTLNYDEMDYVIEGQLDVLIDGEKISAKAGELIHIPHGSSIEFSATGFARFIYITYPANWQEQ
ncbi:MAG: cupin domain-containing protein [Lactobacillales bacterium]|jgi:ethanolamine utilization protein EutQ|nr:cupin domain-containing protein [Lactobacillales bacterium]